jgi:glucokinase
MKSAVLVNGVPASGKSTVARALADATGWPLLTLDTVKDALFAHLGTGDRDYNRLLGRASYEAIFALAADFPDDAVVLIDAWFGFQPREALDRHLARAKIARAVEIWCHAAPDVIGARYAARLHERSAGHLGAGYVPELIELAQRAKPLGAFPLHAVDTTQAFDLDAAVAWIRTEVSRRD